MVVVGQCLYDRLVEQRGLVGAKQLPHREDMRQCRFLKLAKISMTAINCRRHSRAIAMLGLHRLGQSRIIGFECQLQRAPLHRETLLEQFDLGALSSVERQFMVENIV